MRTLIGRVWGSRLRLRRVVVPLVSRRRRRLCHGLLLVHRRGRRVLPRWHSFVYGVQALGLGERGDFVIRREALESCGRLEERKKERTSERWDYTYRYRESRPTRTFNFLAIIRLYVIPSWDIASREQCDDSRVARIRRYTSRIL